MFNKTALALAFSTLVCASSAYAIVSARTPLVVGFKPVFTNKTGKGAVTGHLALGGTVSVKKQDIANILGFADRDGDKPDEANFKYSWAVDGNVLSTTTTVTIPNDMALIDKRLVLSITPISISGEPLTGDPLVLDNLDAAGAYGGDGNGNIGMFSHQLHPEVSNLTLAGALEVGKDLTASYKFSIQHSRVVAHGSEQNIDTVSHLVEDHSIVVWGKVGRTRDEVYKLARDPFLLGPNNEVKVSGQVPAYTIKKDDAGEVLELTIFPRTQNIDFDKSMSLGIHKYQEWFLSYASKAQPVTVRTDGTTTWGDGKVGWPSLEPKDVKINFISSATKAVNGVDGIRPVAAKDLLRATFTPDANGSPNARDYTFQWKAAGTNIGTAEVGKDTFTPGPEYQGKVISVDVLPVKKTMP